MKRRWQVLKVIVGKYISGLREAGRYICMHGRFLRFIYERVMAEKLFPQPVRSVLFVCKANICRSPLAEVYFLDKAMNEGYSIKVSSAGVDAKPGRSLHALASEIARQHGIPLEGHAAKQLSGELMQRADIVLVMELAQKYRVVKLYPLDRHKVFVLGQFCRRGPIDIDDPHLGTREDFQFCFERIKDACDRVIQQLGKQRLRHLTMIGPMQNGEENHE